MTREEALARIAQPAVDQETMTRDFEYVATKLGLSVDELRALHDGPNRSYRDYNNSMGLLTLGTQVMRVLGRQPAMIR
jgi:hypothetical protein